MYKCEGTETLHRAGLQMYFCVAVVKSCSHIWMYLAHFQECVFVRTLVSQCLHWCVCERKKERFHATVAVSAVGRAQGKALLFQASEPVPLHLLSARACESACAPGFLLWSVHPSAWVPLKPSLPHL